MSIKYKMLEKMPNYYKNSKVVGSFLNAIEQALLTTSIDISNENKNLSIITTTDFQNHEKDVGLNSIIADIETKRARIIARLQGNNVLTKSELENVILNYDKTGVEITEDANNYTVNIKFIGRTGRPPNINQIKTVVEDVKPAHLLVDYEFMQNTWSDVLSKVGIWNRAKTQTWNGILEYDDTVWFYISTENNVYKKDDNANAYLVFINGQPYAKQL